MGTGHRIAIVRQEWLDHPDVGADEIVVLTILALHADETGLCWPSQQTIADRIGDRSRQWVNRVLSKLAATGIVQKVRRKKDDGGERSCLYRLVGVKKAETADPRSGEDLAPSPAWKEGDTSGTEAVFSVSDRGRGCHPPRHVTPESEHNTCSLSAGERVENPDLGDTVTAMPQVPAEDWQPSDQALVWAMDRYPQMDIATHAERFVLKARAKGYRFTDVEAGWKSWLVADAKTPATRTMAGGLGHAGGCAAPRHRVPPSEARFNAWASVAQQAA